RDRRRGGAHARGSGEAPAGHTRPRASETGRAVTGRKARARAPSQYNTGGAVFLHRTYLYNPLQDWLTGAVTAAIAFVVALLLRRVLVSGLGALAGATTTSIDHKVV